MKKLLIIGAGGFGREVAVWARDVRQAGADWEMGGFLDANPRALDAFQPELPILGDPETWNPSPDELFVCGIGTPAIKLPLCRRLLEKGGRFLTLVHPTARIGPRCRIGTGCVLCPGAILTCDVTLGDFVMLNLHATAGHDAVMGDGCTLSAHADATGWVRLGEGVFMGSHAAAIPKTRVADWAVIGAGSVAMKQVPARTTVFGMPAAPV